MGNIFPQLLKTRTRLGVERIIVAEFLKRGYKKTYNDASLFQSEIERELPGINKWVSRMNMNRRSIEDVVADGLKIPGNNSSLL